MRDATRIPALLAAIHNVWKRNPELRLAQLLIAAASKSGRSIVCPELSSLEDDQLLRRLERFDSAPTIPAVTSPDLNRLTDRFHSDEVIDGVTFKHNQHVRILHGEFSGVEGFIIDLLSLAPTPMYRVERMDTGFDITIAQSGLVLVNNTRPA